MRKTGNRDQGTGIREQGSGIRDQGTETRDQGTIAFVPCSLSPVPSRDVVLRSPGRCCSLFPVPCSLKRGFSLIEVIISIVVLSSSFLGIAHVLSNTTTQNIDVDISITAIMLARETMDITKAKSFSSVASVSSTSFSGDFSNYSYTVGVNYVNSSDLDTTVVGPTSYKRIVVTVTADGWTGNVALYDLKTDV